MLWLAAGRSLRVAAEAAEVSASTVAGWRRDPLFAAELEAVRAVYASRPLDGPRFLDRLEEAEGRLAAAELSARRRGSGRG
jgi:hypothetical protein